MKENRSKTKYSDVYSHNIDTKSPLGKIKKRGKKVHNDTKEQICREKKN